MAGSARSIAVFLLLFGILFGSGYLLLGSAWGERWAVRPWVGANIRTARLLSAMVGLDARVEDGRTLSTDDGGVLVSRGCDGLGALLIVGSAILGFPAPWRARAIGVILGAVGVFAINAFRITTLLWISIHWPDRLQFFHIDIWQPVMMVVSFALFLGWGVLLAGRPREKMAGGSA